MLLKHYPGEQEFHKYWPEHIYGSDKYGHFMQVIRIKDINIEKVPLCFPTHFPPTPKLT